MKEVTTDEITLRLYQEIYNEKAELVEIHEKYPSDLGHKSVKRGEHL